MSGWVLEFLRWHVATDHEWDAALHLEAIGLSVEGMSRQIGESLAPAIERAAETLREFIAAWESRS